MPWTPVSTSQGGLTVLLYCAIYYIFFHKHDLVAVAQIERQQKAVIIVYYYKYCGINIISLFEARCEGTVNIIGTINYKTLALQYRWHTNRCSLGTIKFQ